MNPDIVLLLFVAGLSASLWYAQRRHMQFAERMTKALDDQRRLLEEEISYREYADQQYSDLHRRHIALHQHHEALQALYAIRTVELLQLSSPTFARVVAWRKASPGKTEA